MSEMDDMDRALLVTEINYLRERAERAERILAALRAAIERVRALHDVRERRHIGWADVTCCSGCSDDDNPCPTLRALEETP